MMRQQNTSKRITASCTWGDGPDVLLVNGGKGYVIYRVKEDGYISGVSSQGSMDLTVAEAEMLAYELLEAVRQVRDLENSYQELMEQEQNDRSYK